MKNIDSVEVVWDNRPVGRLVNTKDGLNAFEYSAEQLQSGISISPFELPLRRGVFISKRTPFEGGFGVFDDCLPDGWGQLVLDRYLQKRGINPRSLTIIDRLSLVGSTGRGALEFYPDRSVMMDSDYVDFEKLALEAEKILGCEEYVGEGIEDFQLRGGSPGGARPKVFAKYENKEWLVKFRAKGDSYRISLDEFKYSKIARACGVIMPETRMFEGKYFGVERFDRTPNGKVHTISMAGLLGADYRIPSLDYLHVFKVSSVLSHSMGELWRIYRLMAFNYLIENKDDHAKNFAFIFKEGEWRLSPAFDILPSNGINGYHTTSINDKIVPEDSDLISLAVKMGLPRIQAATILQEMREKIREYDTN